MKMEMFAVLFLAVSSVAGVTAAQTAAPKPSAPDNNIALQNEIKGLENEIAGLKAQNSVQAKKLGNDLDNAKRELQSHLSEQASVAKKNSEQDKAAFEALKLEQQKSQQVVLQENKHLWARTMTVIGISAVGILILGGGLFVFWVRKDRKTKRPAIDKSLVFDPNHLLDRRELHVAHLQCDPRKEDATQYGQKRKSPFLVFFPIDGRPIPFIASVHGGCIGVYPDMESFKKYEGKWPNATWKHRHETARNLLHGGKKTTPLSLVERAS